MKYDPQSIRHAEVIQDPLSSKEEVIESIRWITREAIARIERFSNDYSTASENQKRDLLVVMLWALDVHAHPEENCKGHADFLVFNNAKRIVSVAEAKLLRRKGYYLAGIDQLVGYMTTREACGVMIGFRHESSTVDFLPSLIHSITSGDCDGIVITELTPEEFHFTSRCSHPRGTEVTVLHFLADI